MVLVSKSECKREAELDMMLTIPILRSISNRNKAAYRDTLPARDGDSHSSEKTEKRIKA